MQSFQGDNDGTDDKNEQCVNIATPNPAGAKSFNARCQEGKLAEEQREEAEESGAAATTAGAFTLLAAAAATLLA